MRNIGRTVIGLFANFSPRRQRPIAAAVLGKGSILFVSATLHYRGTVMQAHVSAAKAAIDALSQVVAVEFGPFGVRSNVIAPGGIDGTEGAERLMPREFREKSGSEIPLGRLGMVEEIADCTGISPFR